MLIRDIKQRYVGSMFGLFWFFFQPIMTVLIYTFVFSFVLKAKLGPEFGGMNFSIWLISGLVPWMFFNEVLVRGTNSLLDNSSLIKKTIVDTRWIILSNTLSSLFSFLVFLVIVFILLGVFGIALSLKVILLPCYILMMGIFAFGLALSLSALNVYLRDIAQFVSIFLNIWFYLTPIVYPISIIPEKYRFFLEINPVYHFISGFRFALLSTNEPMNISSFLYVAFFSILTLVMGLKIFNRLKDGFADVL